MTNDLRQNGYIPPLYTSYGGGDIPFVYPPLMFYFTGLLSDVTDISILQLFQFLPAVFHLLIIVTVYLLSRDLIDSEIIAGLAALIFAILPIASFQAGEVVRTPSLLFVVLAVHQAFLMYTRNKNVVLHIVLTALFGALAALSHPQQIEDVAISLVLVFLFYGINKRGFVKSVAAALGILLLTAPYWALVLSRFGLAPYINAHSQITEDFNIKYLVATSLG